MSEQAARFGSSSSSRVAALRATAARETMSP